jgi:hypothetical protein
MLLALLLIEGTGRAWAFGDVAASVNADGKLTLGGDEAPNMIEVAAGPLPGVVVVTGLDGTAINGSPSGTFVGVVRIEGSMKEGADRLEVREIELEKAFKVKLGGDDDTFVAEGIRVVQNMEVKGGSGQDRLVVRQGVRVGGELLLKAGKDADVIEASGLSVGSFLEVGGGNGVDVVTIQTTTVDGGATTELRGGSEDDTFTLLDDDFENDIVVKLGGGDDDLAVEDCDFDGAIFADGGDGEDELILGGGNSYDLSEPRLVLGFEDIDD